ncbi:BREX-2 system phosphatase PglZ [Baekduia sp. Peel2402]|uniref:BREX-2 system phosphatase PglZ n=1 Tax=Baekduia sp. Peel2402 TaxID=3458296 RepID=UPI00403E8B24
MSAGPLTAAQLLPLLRRLQPRMGDSQVIGVHHHGAWAGNEQLVVDGDTYVVRQCPSLLEVHDALAHLSNDERLVLISPFEVRELGMDIVSRFVRQDLVRPRPLLAVLSLFGARDVDRRVARADWMLDELLRLAPAEGYPRTAAGTLTFDRAWDELLRRGLELPGNALTLVELVRWGAAASHVRRLRESRPELREALHELLGPIDGAGAVLAAVEHGPASAAITGGLVARLLDPEERAAGRFEAAVLGNTRLEGATAWAQAAERVVFDEPDPNRARGWASEAAQLAERLELTGRAERSPVMPGGFDARLQRMAEALDGQRLVLAQACDAVREHVLAREHPRLPSALDMVQRLARRPQPMQTGRLAEAVAAEVADGGWAVWARSVAADAAIGSAADAVGRLLAAVDADRRLESLRFAELACSWDGDRSDGVLGVEHVLEEVVAPVLAASPTLVVVVDGLSQGVARELLAELVATGWQERRPTSMTRRPAALAVLPSLTGVSRSALLSGVLGAGAGQAVEKSGLASHERLRELTGTTPPLLLHQRDLRAATEGLAADVAEAIANGPRLVGVVVNAVDDALSGGAQQRTRWTSDEVPVLRSLLDAAAAANRAVVILADHGHVPERPGMSGIGSAGSSSSGARRRSADGESPREGEILADGSRVVGTDRVVLAVDPLIRYVAKPAAGYHGGASPEELVAPVLVLTASASTLDGLEEQPLDEPDWWHATSPVAIDPIGRRPSPIRMAADGQLALAGVEASVARDTSGPDWIDALLRSALLAEQRRRNARTGVDDARLRTVLEVLERAGKLTKAALVQSAGLPVARADGVLAVIRAILNVEGVQVLTVDQAADAVELNVDLLREQFGV